MKLNLFNLRSFFFTKPIQTSSRNSFSLQKCFPFCTTNHPRNFFNDVVPGTSAVYSHALKFQRPVTIKWKPHLENNASFIGTVSGELKRMNSKFGDFGVYTKLRVRNSNQPNSSSFWVLLNMWDDVAEIAYEHLKPNHFICVSGRLESFTRADDDDSGNLRLDYK
ncbi:protein OSB1, partial [Trifolium pratense]